mgnify:CR=1 FL=1
MNRTIESSEPFLDDQRVHGALFLVDENSLGLHLDGARLWNALVAKNETPLQYGKVFDSISVCLSKGLGCPIGSVLTGSKEFMDKALRVRKVLGGGMRQAGYLAAAGIYALDANIERLAEDHKRAKELAEVLSKTSYIKKIDPVETNILIFYLNDDIDILLYIFFCKKHCSCAVSDVSSCLVLSVFFSDSHAESPVAENASPSGCIAELGGPRA